MTVQTYDYNGIIAKYWDLLRGDTSKWTSRPYFLKLIQQSGQLALDVACGTGRLLFDYLDEGIDMDGVDYAADMIAVCRQKAEAAGVTPQLTVQTMQDLDLPRRYQTIIVPSSSFQHLTNRDEVQQALRRFYDHLNPGGLLAMSLRVFEPEDEIAWEIDQEAVRPSDGATIRHWFRCSYDVPNRLQNTEDRYEIIQNGDIVESYSFAAAPYLTWYTVKEALALLQATGFESVQAHADFTFDAAAEDETSFIVLGKRPLR